MPQPGGDHMIIAITTLLVLICSLDFAYAASIQLQSYDLNADNGAASNSSEQEFNGEVTSLERPLSWLRNANSMFGSPAGHVVIQVAKELLHRSAGNSQVG